MYIRILHIYKVADLTTYIFCMTLEMLNGPKDTSKLHLKSVFEPRMSGYIEI